MAKQSLVYTIKPVANRPLLNTPDPSRHYQPRPGAYAIIINGADELLTLETDTGVFLPGGGQDPGETLVDTLIREVREELGVAVAPLHYLLAADDCRFSPVYQQHFHIQAHYFYAAVASDAVFVTEPNMRAVWRPLPTACHDLTRSNDRWFAPLLSGAFQIVKDPGLQLRLPAKALGDRVWTAQPSTSSGLLDTRAAGASPSDGHGPVPNDHVATFTLTEQGVLSAWVTLSLGKRHYQILGIGLSDQISARLVADQLHSLFTPIKIIDPSGLLSFNA